MDIGITHPTIDTYINNSSSEATRGSAANIYANAKNKSANKIIHDKNLDIEFQAITFSTYGGFGSSAHTLIKTMRAEACPTTSTLGRDQGQSRTPTCNSGLL